MKLNRPLLWKFLGGTAVLLFAVLFTFTYSGYLHIKKMVRSEISSRATALIGQRVELQDISLSTLSAAIKNPGFLGGPALHLHNIAIQNPDGFADGQLVRVKEIVITPDMRALLRGDIHLTGITVSSPEISLVHDAKGGLNISEKLRQFFSKKSTSTYQVDTVSIRSGSFGLDGQKRFGLTDVNLEMNGISSQKDTKTMIRGSLIHAGANKILLDGWAYLKSTPNWVPEKSQTLGGGKGFALTVSSPGFVPISLISNREKYDTPIARSAMAVKLVLEGGPETGVHLTSHITSHNPGALGICGGVQVLSLDADAFYDIRRQSIVVHDASLRTDASTVAQMSGLISNVNQKPSYSAHIKITGLDLSAFGISTAFKVSGRVTSDDLSVKGTLVKVLPSLSGSVRIEGAAFKSKDFDLDKINGVIHLSSSLAKTFSVTTGISANVQKIKDAVLKQSPSVKLTLVAQGTLDTVTIHTSASVAAFSYPVRQGKTASFRSANVSVDGSLRLTGKAYAFAGKSSIGISDLLYGDIHVPSFQSTTGINFTNNTIALKALSVETKDIRYSADETTLRFDGRSNSYTADLRSANISFPARKTEIKKVMLHINVSRRNNAPGATSSRWGGGGVPEKSQTFGDGSGTFSAGNILSYNESLGSLSGSCRFDAENFYLDGLLAVLPSGSITLTGQGKLTGEPFPLRINMVAKDLNLGQISGIYAKFATPAYQLSGKLGNASFDCSIEDIDAIRGNAVFDVQNLTVSAAHAKRPLAKDWTLAGRIDFKGKDLDFSAHAGNKGVAAETSGSIKDFSETNKTALIKVLVPGTQAASIREAFWDIFPDRLLYAGLDGAASSEILLRYSPAGTNITGTITLENFSLSGENGEYTIGPVNGILPIAYADKSSGQEKITIPLFDRAEFDARSRDYSHQFTDEGYNKITVGSLRYGFRLLDSLSFWVKQKGTALDVGRFSANIFGGTLNGSAFATIEKGVNYRIGFIVNGLSLTTLCNGIEPIKGYISGKLNGIAALKGTGADLSGLIGKADFWTYSDKNEKTKLSKEFLQKVGGPSMGSYLSERNFDKGIISVYAQKGDLVFEDLEISNTNILGMRDLSIKVAPSNNRISIDNLMWELVEAAHRAEAKSK